MNILLFNINLYCFGGLPHGGTSHTGRYNRYITVLLAMKITEMTTITCEHFQHFSFVICEISTIMFMPCK